MVGKLSQFVCTHDLVTAHVEEVQLFFEANNIQDAKKVMVFKLNGRKGVQGSVKPALTRYPKPIQWNSYPEH